MLIFDLLSEQVNVPNDSFTKYDPFLLVIEVKFVLQLDQQLINILKDYAMATQFGAIEIVEPERD